MQQKRPRGRPRKVQNAPITTPEQKVENGYSDAIMGFNPNSIGTQLSQLDTLFISNRWYLLSNMRQVISELYVEHGLVQSVVNVPVDDALRGGVEIKSKQLSPEQIEQLQVLMDREDILHNVVGLAAKWNRLYGGAGIVIITDQEPDTELDLDLIGPDSKLEFRAVDLWELFWDKQNVEGFNPQLQEHEFTFYNYYGIKLHKSRVMKLRGITAPSFIRPRMRGWGISILEPLVRSINQYLKANDLSFEVLDEFKIDVFKLKGLASTLVSANGTAKIQNRIAATNQAKNYQNAITLDSEDDYLQKQLSFAGLADTMREIRMQIAADLRMPLSKIFGESASGFGSGQDSIENYNSMVEGEIRAKIKFDILRILEMLCKKEFDFIPDDLSITFKPLRILSAEQEENVRNSKFNRIMTAKQSGLISDKEFKDAVNRDDLLGIVLETETDSDMIAIDLESKNPADNQEEIGSAKIPAMQIVTREVAKNEIANPGDIDESVWERAKKACLKQYGKLKYGVVMAIYKIMKGIK
jgi:hypothetical protein